MLDIQSTEAPQGVQEPRDVYAELEEKRLASIPSEELTLQGYKSSWLRVSIFYLLCVVSLGALVLLSRWFPSLRMRMVSSKCSLAEADSVLVESSDGSQQEENVEIINVLPDLPMRAIRYRHVVYIQPSPLDTFKRLKYDCGVSFEEVHQLGAMHLTKEDRELRRTLLGRNHILVPIPSIFVLLIDEVLNPFYVFQIFSIILWCVDDYVIYSIAIFLMSAISAITEVMQSRSNLKSIHEMAMFTCKVSRVIPTGVEQVNSDELVPGDVITVETDMTLPCDLALLSGECVVNESMLTGESIPVVKSALPHVAERADYVYDPDEDQKYTLLGGTTVIQINETTHGDGDGEGDAEGGGASTSAAAPGPAAADAPRALVVRSGFATAKGELVRSILYPKPLQFKFYADSFKFLGVLFGIAVLGFFYSIYWFRHWGVGWEKIVIRCLDLVTIAVPPALPIALSIGVVFAVSRLKDASISCIAPNRVNLGGRVNRVCFDKTGTLTSDGLDVSGVLEVQDAEFQSLQSDVKQSAVPLLSVLGACHALSEVSGQLVGDPLDVKMFEATNWVMLRPTRLQAEGGVVSVVCDRRERFMLGKPCNLEFGIVRRFDFASRWQRMGVVVKRVKLTSKQQSSRATPASQQPGDAARLPVVDVDAKKAEEGDASPMQFLVKGAPEVVRELCAPESLPREFEEQLESLTERGYRVIACASRVIPLDVSLDQVMRSSRVELEKDMVFHGFLVMENKLKPTTTDVITKLQRANIPCVMVTGDNVLTGANVAMQCGILPTHEYVRIVDVKGGFVHTRTVPHDQGEPRRYALPSYVCATDEEAAQAKAASPFSWEELLCGESLALTGKAFAELHALSPERFLDLIVQVKVFARMFPDQKQALVEMYSSLGETVSMCGDGSNDCGALKAADVGVSLSDADASIAAPFTSKEPRIDCVYTILREGRCALVTSFTDFKFMAAYSLIQTISILLLYRIDSLFGDWQFLYIDLFIILPLAWALSRTGAYRELSPLRPTERLISVSVIASLLIQSLLNLLVQGGAWWWLHQQDWFEPLVPDEDDDNILCPEATTVFLISSFQYIWSVLAFCCMGKPYRNAFYTNYAFVVILVVLTAATTYLTLIPHKALMDFFEIVEVPRDWKVKMLVLTAVNLVLACAIEIVITHLFVSRRTQDIVPRLLGRGKQKPKKYQAVGPDAESKQIGAPLEVGHADVVNVEPTAPQPAVRRGLQMIGGLRGSVKEGGDWPEDLDAVGVTSSSYSSDENIAIGE